MKGKRLLSIFILTLIILSALVPMMLYQAPEVGAQSSGGAYQIPITIKEKSGTHLIDLPTQIVLSENNFQDWDKVTSDGSDIYFTDSNGDPLYYYIESFDLANKQATIWVKVPDIPANGEIVVYMHYGASNPYASYHDQGSVGENLADVEISISRCEAFTRTLPPETLYLLHNITYIPSATQFTHTFSAINNSAAGYILETPDEYGWAVYANPYDSIANNATLISEITINLPYSEVYVDNVTLYVKKNGTGNYAQLWVQVLNSTGGVVAEVTESSLSTDWTEIVIPINANLSNSLKLWINATVESSTTAGEEIDIKNVTAFVSYETNPEVKVFEVCNVDYFHVNASHIIELGSSEYVYDSEIILKVIEKIVLNETTYPVNATLIGNETIGGYIYNVYKIHPATYAQPMNIDLRLENTLKDEDLAVIASGTESTVALVGEQVNINIPIDANVFIPELNETYANVTSVSKKFTTEGTYTIAVEKVAPSEWTLAYRAKQITVKYGTMTFNVTDCIGNAITYTNITFEFVDKDIGQTVRQVSKLPTNGSLYVLDQLEAGDYTVKVRLGGVVLYQFDINFNHLTDGTMVNATSLGVTQLLYFDYKGVRRIIAWEPVVNVLSVGSLSDATPYAITKIALQGSGYFNLSINYRTYSPAKVEVSAEGISNVQYTLNETMLTISGYIDGSGSVTIEDYYKVVIEAHDRLGNLMPSFMYAFIDGDKHSGSILTKFLPMIDQTVEIELPEEVNGFDFYGFEDGFAYANRTINANFTDVILKVYYRVATKFENITLYKIETEEGGTRIYAEGRLVDYYNNNLSYKSLTVIVRDVGTNEEVGRKSTYTNSDGYFISPTFEVENGTYVIEVQYAGDTIYADTVTTEEVTIGEVPEEAPEEGGEELPLLPVNTLILAVGVIAIIGAIVAITRTLRHTIYDTYEEIERFTRRRR